MRGVSFEWREETKEKGEKIGFIAQEMLEIEPRVVQLNEAGPDQKKDSYYGISYENLTAHLVEAIKEQNVIINNLKERIERLENQHGTE